MTSGRLPEPSDRGSAVPAGADVDDVTAGLARALAATLSSDGALREIVRGAADRVVRDHLHAAAEQALADALAGGFGEALDEQVEQALVQALGGTDTGADPRRPVFANVADWVRDLLLPNYQRPTSELQWCAWWFEHSEAVSRLEATWRAWEHLRHEGPTGPAVWFRDFCDPMMRELTGRDGPFHACKTAARGGHTLAVTWPLAAPPAGLFRDADHPDEQ